MPSDHRLSPSAATIHWGHFDPALSPVLTIEPGDSVTVTSVSGAPDDLPVDGSGMTVRPELRAVHAACSPDLGPHILTGPIAVKGAEPGDALRISIDSVELADDWGFNLMRPGAGTLPDDFPVHDRVHIGLDRSRNLCRMPWGLEVPARPFFGVMGTAPPPTVGRVTSVVPGAFGGNIDNTELVSGSVLCLPVFVPGGLLSVGDGHAAQGDGEVCLTAVETGLTGRLRVELVKAAHLSMPRAETPTHLIAMGFDADLDVAAQTALREAIAIIRAHTGLSEVNAYRLCSVAVDLRITQLVNRHKGVHAMIPRWALGDAGPAARVAG